MANVQRLKRNTRIGNQISKYLCEMLEMFPHMKEEGYICPDIEQDQLFEATYSHEGGKTCQKCNRGKVVERDIRTSSAPKISLWHYWVLQRSHQGRCYEGAAQGGPRNSLRGDGGSWSNGQLPLSRHSWHLRLCRLAQEQAMAALRCSYCCCIRKGTALLHSSTGDRRDEQGSGRLSRYV